MCFRIFFGVYILLLIFSTVIPHTIPDNHHDGDSKIPKHHTRSKSSKNEHKLAKALANDDLDPKSVREHDHHNEKIDDDHLEILDLENKAIKPEEDVSRTGISDGTNTEIHLDHNLEVYDDYDIENSRAENDVTDKLEQIEENNEAVDYSSSTLSNIYQDAMIDVKGRNGEALMEDGRRSGMPDENIYNMRPVIRNPAIPEDYVDSIFKPHDFRKEYFNQPRVNFRYNNDMMPQIYNKRLTYKDLLEPLLRQNNYPLYNYYNMMNSKETTYPRPNGHETLWGQSNNGHSIVTNFGIPSYSSSEMLCSTCHQKSVLNSHEHRRSIELPYITANGRRLEFVPVDSNAYPLARDADISTQNPEINGLEDAREGRAQQSETSGNQDIEQMHKIIIQKSNPIVMNGRMGLTGYHLISGF